MAGITKPLRYGLHTSQMLCNTFITSVTMPIILNTTKKCFARYSNYKLQLCYRYTTLTSSTMYICDQVCENQPCPHKLHLVRYSQIYPILNKIFFHSVSFKRFSMDFCRCDVNFVLLA